MEERQRILAVDDSADNLTLLNRLLKRQGFDVVTASTGSECLSLSAEQHPDLIILDVAMPGMDGFETLTRLRENEMTRDIPVIFLTANSRDAGSIERGLALGADEYLTKPIEQDELMARVRSILRIVNAERQLEQLKADFQSMLVHDLRSPLSVIIGVLELGVKGEFEGHEKEMRELLSTALTNSHKMLSLINDILDVAKFEAGKIQLNRQAGDLNAVVDAASNRLKILAREKGLELAVETDPALPVCEFDGEKMDQVITNLLSNSIKFTPAGGHVSVRTQTHRFSGDVRVRDGAYAEVEVEDTGTGIPVGEIPHIFDRYRQARTSGSMSEKGTGLGLTIVKKVVEAHGGRVFVESSPGRGTKFSVILPVEEE